ncbi:hypothetical protein [uncultured Gammaproteobacteria bacterium]|jgi:hypothetical protein|nr:hypothetical protein [uncultured Gammaproteobacteria bacterium]VVH54741.1 hypothetical protein BAZOLSSOX_1640 [uncultured Gammaproteobacteria bacterium]
MPIKIEQVTKEGLVVNDYDTKLKPTELKKLLSKQANLAINSNKNPFIAKYKNKEINICIKVISYLGIPHLHYKKRIQIPKEWKQILQQKHTLLLGVYSYKNQNTFCLFDTTKYKNNQLNNSSAHIHTMDLHKARKDGIFEKTDKQGNNIIVFTEQNFQKVFDMVLLNQQTQLSNELNIFDQFSKTLNLNWLGVDCYDEMVKNNCNNAQQGEWVGFYLEYKFEQFLNNKPSYKKYCQYIQNKSKGSIDLDLWFEQKKFLGDLKAHTIGGGLIGNDKFNAYKAVRLHNKFWYISFNHTTEKDKCHGAKVMQKWNVIRGKNSMKYLNRMKHSVNLKSFDVLEISNINLKHLKEFNQGKNSNGKPRAVKISIHKTDLENDNFVIYRQKL